MPHPFVAVELWVFEDIWLQCIRLEVFLLAKLIPKCLEQLVAIKKIIMRFGLQLSLSGTVCKTRNYIFKTLQRFTQFDLCWWHVKCVSFCNIYPSEMSKLICGKVKRDCYVLT